MEKGRCLTKWKIVGEKGEESKNMLYYRWENFTVRMIVGIVKCYASRMGSARCLYVVDYVRVQSKSKAGIV